MANSLLQYFFETRKSKENVGSFDKLVKPIRNSVGFFLLLSFFFFFFIFFNYFFFFIPMLGGSIVVKLFLLLLLLLLLLSNFCFVISGGKMAALEAKLFIILPPLSDVTSDTLATPSNWLFAYASFVKRKRSNHPPAKTSDMLQKSTHGYSLCLCLFSRTAFQFMAMTSNSNRTISYDNCGINSLESLDGSTGQISVEWCKIVSLNFYWHVIKR